jgi:hypothetical protein
VSEAELDRTLAAAFGDGPSPGREGISEAEFRRRLDLPGDRHSTRPPRRDASGGISEAEFNRALGIGQAVSEAELDSSLGAAFSDAPPSRELPRVAPAAGGVAAVMEAEGVSLTDEQRADVSNLLGEWAALCESRMAMSPQRARLYVLAEAAGVASRAGGNAPHLIETMRAAVARSQLQKPFATRRAGGA